MRFIQAGSSSLDLDAKIRFLGVYYMSKFAFN